LEDQKPERKAHLDGRECNRWRGIKRAIQKSVDAHGCHVE
jgi:hypothetical protein